jgi:hypothetical protein
MNIASHLRRRCEWYLVPLLYAVVVAWVYREVWRGKVGVGWDLIESYWPDLAFVAHELARGNFPLWNPFERGGVPALGDPQAALFYPVQGLLALGAAASGDTPWLLIQIKELAHHWLAAALLYLFLRTRQLPWQAALTAGLVFLTGEPWFEFKSNNFLQSVAWVPLVWVAIDAAIARPSWRRAAALAAALYLPASVGSPPGYFYALLLVSGYGAFRLVTHLGRELGPGARHPGTGAGLLRLGGCLGLAAVLALATQLVFLVPVRELLALSGRAVRTVDFAVGGACDLRIVAGSLAAPYGPGAVHTGLLTLVLALAALVLRPRRDAGAPIFFLLWAVLFLMLGAGSQTPLLRWLVVNLPGFGLFRASCRYLVAYPLCVAALAGYGMATLLDPRSRLRAPVVTVAALGALVAAGTALLLAVSGDVLRTRGSGLPPLLVVVLASAAALSLVLLPRRLALVAGAIWPLLLSLEASETLRRNTGYQPRPDSAEDDRQRIAGLAGLGTLEYRMFDEFLLEQRSGSRLRLREMRGYTSADPLARVDYQQIVAAARRSASLHLLGEYNVRYVFYGPHSTKGWSKHLLTGAPATLAPTRFRQLTPVIHEALHPAPQLAWYGAVRRVATADILPALAAARDQQGVRRLAFVDRGPPGPPPAPGLARLEAVGDKAPPSLAGKVTSFETDEVIGTVNAPADGLVVLNEMMFPGWRVYVDDREQPALTVDFCLRGVLVTRGTHRIRWVYTPTHFHLFLGLWTVGLFTFAASGAAALHRRRRRRSSKTGRTSEWENGSALS